MDCKWEASGTIVEKVERKSQKNAEWRGYSMNLLTAGITLEVQLTKDQFDSVDESQNVRCGGYMRENNGRVNFHMTQLRAQEQPRGGKPEAA